LTAARIKRRRRSFEFIARRNSRAGERFFLQKQVSESGQFLEKRKATRGKKIAR